MSQPNSLQPPCRFTGGRLPIVGVGGVSSGAQAFDMIASGARLVQIYTALVYEGPSLVCRIRDQLQDILSYDIALFN